MSIATEITRLQGIKADIRTALVTQGIASASSHNMADFSADILAIQGSSEGVYISVTCGSEYIGQDIILSANESELDRKQCPSSLVVNFFVSADDVTLPATFTISNNLNNVTTSFEANMLGWYDNVELSNNIIELVPVLTSNTGSNGTAFLYDARNTSREAWYAFDKVWTYNDTVGFDTSTTTKICYNFNTAKTVKKFGVVASPEYNYYSTMKYQLYYSDDGTTWNVASTQETLSFNSYEMQYVKSTETKPHKYWGVQVYNPNRSDTYICGLQFFGY